MANERFGVCGAGTMGVGIAYAASMAGYDVVLYDLNEKLLEKAEARIEKYVGKGVEKGKIRMEEAESIRSRIALTAKLDDFKGASIVVEAIIEDLAIKQGLFSNLEQIAGPDAILATNTSSLSVTEIARDLDHPGRVIGMHFFNPAHIMKLVEIIRGHRTDDTTLARTTEITKNLGKAPVVAADSPGFIVNRVARNFYGEALHIVGEGAATHDQIDRCLKAVGFRMGPFELMDLIGIDVNFAVTKSVYGQYFDEPRFRPHLIQQKMVQSGLLGRKSGGGFYSDSD